MSSHARLGPSNHRWPHCPGSIREEAAYPDVAGEAAIDGTGSHLLLEMCMKNNVDALAYLGQIIGANDSEKPEGWLVAEDRCKRVQMCLDYLSRRHDELTTAYPDCTLYIDSETRANPGAMYGRDDWWGTVDITIAVVDDTGHLVFIEACDYKDGRGYVHVPNNTQLISYVGGKMRNYIGSGPELVKPFKIEGVDGCRISIVQPKTSPVVRYENMAASEVIADLDSLAVAASATDAPDASLIPGKHCQWCKHKKNCTAETKRSVASMDLVKLDMSQLAVDVTSMTSDQLADLADARKGIDDAFDRVETEIASRIEQGQQVPGYTMAPGRNTRVWNEDEESIVKALKGRRMKKDDIYPAKLITPAALMKSELLTDAQKKKIEADYITNKSGSLKLKQISRDQLSSPAFKDTDQIPSFF